MVQKPLHICMKYFRYVIIMAIIFNNNPTISLLGGHPQCGHAGMWALVTKNDCCYRPSASVLDITSMLL